VGEKFLLVPAYPGCPGSKAVKRSLLLLSLITWVAGAVGEEDPVYKFLKLTSVMPREGVSVIPGDDHYCCSRTDQDFGLGTDEHAGPYPASGF